MSEARNEVTGEATQICKICHDFMKECQSFTENYFRCFSCEARATSQYTRSGIKEVETLQSIPAQGDYTVPQKDTRDFSNLKAPVYGEWLTKAECLAMIDGPLDGVMVEYKWPGQEAKKCAAEKLLYKSTKDKGEYECSGKHVMEGWRLVSPNSSSSKEGK